MSVAANKKCSPYNFRFIQDDPLKVARILYPKLKLYRQQEEILYSIWHNDETYCAAGNMMGKDFIASLAAVLFFLTREPCKIVATSAGGEHLGVFWDELQQRIDESKIPLRVEQGGPLEVLHYEVRKWWRGKEIYGCTIKAQVADPNRAEKMQGRHTKFSGDGIPKGLFIGDEASGLHDAYYEKASTWADRLFIFGNTWPCDNFFKYAFKGKPGTDDRGGDIPREEGRKGYYRKTFHMSCFESPNIKLAQAQIAAGKEPTDEIIVPGVKPWSIYQKNLRLWDKQQQSVALLAEWYDGDEVKLFPESWLARALAIGVEMKNDKRKADAAGVDPAEGGDWTTICVTDFYGIIKLIRRKTPNTCDVRRMVKDVIKEYDINPQKVFFDTGGGGKQHVDTLREEGYNCQSISFQEGVTIKPTRAKRLFPDMVDFLEDKGAYTNRRCMMYGEASIVLDPYKYEAADHLKKFQTFGFPPDGEVISELVRQLRCIPKLYVEGRLYIPPKNRRSTVNVNEKTLAELLGRSPDEADAFVLAVYAMTGKRTPFVLKGYS